MTDGARMKDQARVIAKEPPIDVETASDWEEDLLAAAEGHSELPEPNQENDEQAKNMRITTSKPDDQVLSYVHMPGAPKPRVRNLRTASIKYTPTEKYWLNRTYRLYRTQQGAQKLAKSRKLPYHPSEGVLTHQNMMDAFNDRFAGKFVDGLGPRPKRERHAFGLWSAKNMREDDEAMKGAVPDYWKMEQKTKPHGIILDEEISRTWDCDQYLGVSAKPNELRPQQSRKRKANAVEPTQVGMTSKKSRTEVVDASVGDGRTTGEIQLNVFSEARAQQWPTHRRRYSAPSLGNASRSPLAQVNGDFDYSWSQAKAQLAWQEQLRNAVARGVEMALNAI